MAPAAPAAAKPMVGIVIACVLGLPTLIWSMLPGEPAATEWAGPMQNFSKGVHLFGCTALLIGALLSLAGHRRGNAVVRGASWVMIVVLGGMMVMTWSIASGELMPEFGAGMVVPLMIVITGIMLGPWALYLFLFRKSKHP